MKRSFEITFYYDPPTIREVEHDQEICVVSQDSWVGVATGMQARLYWGGNELIAWFRMPKEALQTMGAE